MHGRLNEEALIVGTTATDMEPSPAVEPAGTEAPETAVPEDVASRIAEAAYRKADARGFEPGHELDDWLDAEKRSWVGSVGSMIGAPNSARMTYQGL